MPASTEFHMATPAAVVESPNETPQADAKEGVMSGPTIFSRLPT